MKRSCLSILLALFLLTSVSMAVPHLQPLNKSLSKLPPLDTFNDTIAYDNGTVQWWYGGLTTFRLATKFTPLTTFEVQRVIIALNGTSTTPVNLYLKADSSGYPGGAPLWSGTLLYNLSTTWLGTTIDTTGAPQYTFAGGSNFWLQVNSNGPPSEIYDAAQVVPPRSKTWWAGFGGWVDSPGDNFIRALGEYGTGPIVDVGVDSVWHGQNFFLPNPGTIQVGAKAHNFGTASATFQVACSLFTEQTGPAYVFFTALTPQTITVAAGGTQNVTFPSTAISTNNRYKIRVRTTLAGDINPDNNTKETETQIFTAPAELRYDDGVFAGAAYSSTAGDSWAMKFNPNLTSYTITQVKVEVTQTAGELAARIQVVNDNGAGGAPSTVLWETVQLMTTGWNTFNVNIPGQSGAFYVNYVFENGASTSALRMDNYPSSGQGWVRNTNVWTADPTADDWMMRATVSTGAAPSVDISMSPVSPPIQIPAIGGSFDYNATLTNLGGSPVTFDVWIMVILPTGGYYGPVLGPVSLTLPGSGSITRTRTQSVPGSAPAGTYTYRGYVGTYSTAWDSSSFQFTKLAAGNGAGSPIGEWNNSGESFNPWQSEPAATPAEFSLREAYPNPFNPTTTIGFTLPEAGFVNLSVYDVNGRLVSTLVNGWREAGMQEVIFDASHLPSGLYIYQLTSDDHAAMNKVVLMK